VGTEKRERQKVGKQLRAEAQFAAARRARTRRTAVRVAIAVVALLAVLFAYSALRGDNGDDTATDASTTSGFDCQKPSGGAEPAPSGAVADRSAPDPEPPPSDTPADAIECTTLIEGRGDGAAAGDTVKVNYIGKTPDGNVFDQSYERGQPLDVTLGQGSVIAGWDQGLVGAKVGERRRLVIGSDNAYGAQGSPQGGIPANSPLAFEIDVIDITPGEAAGGSGG
jgi:FKBP-type peptidyl-prolyl cis-trans isomerase